MVLSKTFDTLNKTLTDQQCSLSRAPFVLKMELTFASFKSSRKQPFSNDNSMIFVIGERCICSVTLSMSTEIFPTSVSLEPSMLKITCRKNFPLLSFFINLANNRVKNNFFKNVFQSNGRASLIFL